MSAFLLSLSKSNKDSHNSKFDINGRGIANINLEEENEEAVENDIMEEEDRDESYPWQFTNFLTR